MREKNMQSFTIGPLPFGSKSASGGMLSPAPCAKDNSLKSYPAQKLPPKEAAIYQSFN